MKSVNVYSLVLIGCVMFLAASWVKSQASLVQQKKAVVVSGVERQRILDQNFDDSWIKELNHRPKVNGDKGPIVYETKEQMGILIAGSLAPSECIKELVLYGHGSSGYFCFGNGQTGGLVRSTYISITDNQSSSANMLSSQQEWRVALSPLLGHFCDDAIVTMIGCNVGAEQSGARLVFDLSKFLGVKVRAPIRTVWGGCDYQGEWQEASPDMLQIPSPQALIIEQKSPCAK